MDAIHPGTFNLSKVKWNARSDYEFTDNFKVLQNAFDKNGIMKTIDVVKLKKVNSINANLEFCAWIKKYYEANCKGETTYDALKRRKG